MSGTGTPGAQQTQSDNEQAELRISEALDLGLQVWRTQPAVRDKFLTAQDDLESLLARLTTAEQERDKLAHDVKYLRGQVQLNERLLIETVDRKLAAEARVEPLSEALREVERLSIQEGLRAIARAALACPPQQPEKVGKQPTDEAIARAMNLMDRPGGVITNE